MASWTQAYKHNRLHTFTFTFSDRHREESNIEFQIRIQKQVKRKTSFYWDMLLQVRFYNLSTLCGAFPSGMNWNAPNLKAIYHIHFAGKKKEEIKLHLTCAWIGFCASNW